MAKSSPAISNFNGGEVGPLLSGRVDFEKYGSSCYKMERFIPTVQGPAKRSPGTRFVLPTKYQDKVSYLKRFEFSFDQAYILEFGDQYVRFYTDRGVVLGDILDITNITNASPGVLTYSGTDPANGDWFYVTGVEGMTQINNRYVQVSNVNTGANTFSLKDWFGNAIDTTSYSAYVFNGDMQKVYEIASPYAVADLTNPEGGCALSIVQSGDVLYIGCEGYAPRTLTRSGNTSWAFATYAPTDGPFQTEPLDTKNFTLGASTGTGVSLVCTTNIFENEHVGMLFRLEPINITTPPWETNKAVTATNLRKSDGKYYEAQNSATTGSVRPIHEEGKESDGAVTWEYLHPGYVIIKITAITDAQNATCDIIGPGIAPAEVVAGDDCRYRIGAWGEATGAAFPYKVAFWRDRLWFSGDQRIYASVAGDYSSMSPDTLGEILADNSISLTISVGTVDKIRWMTASDVLLIGTAGSEIAVQEITPNQVLGPENVKYEIQSAEGSRELEPVLVEDSVLFIRIGGRRVIELRFDIQSDSWVPRDMNVLYPEITQTGIVEMSYQKEPDNIIWIVLSNGRLLGMTYDREQNVYGWHRHPIAGTNSKVKSVQVITSPDADVNDVWMIVERSITTASSSDFLLLETDGDILLESGSSVLAETSIIGAANSRKFVEYFAEAFEQNDDIQGAVYLDTSLEFNGVVNESLLPGSGATVQGATNVSFTVTSVYELITEDGLDYIATEANEFLAINDDVFAASDVGREITMRYFDETVEQWRTARAKITTYVSEEQVLCTILAPFPSDDEIAAGGWRLTSSTVSGLWHMEGQTLSALADGAEVKNLTVTNGQITLPVAASRAQIGLPYTSYLATQRIDSGATDGTAQGKTKRFHQIVMRLYASLGGKVGPDASSNDYILYRSLADYMDETPPILTGDTDKFPYPGGYETDARIWVVADQPLPLTVIAMYPRMRTED
jgi:hypothetical protein